MEEETSINFKALRAKFQEEALMSSASQPAVAGKPKHLPPLGGHCSSVLSSIQMAVEHKTPVVPRVFFRDGLRTSGGKRPISFPHQPQHSLASQTADGDASSRHFFKDRRMPLVLPVLPKEPRADRGFSREHQLEMDDLLQNRAKRKGLLLPFKPTSSMKHSWEPGEEPTYADLTCRPASAPGELPSVDRHYPDDRASLQGIESLSEGTPSSLDITISPPSAENQAESENRVFSTLEKAKRRFSRRNMMSSKPKCSSPDMSSQGKSPTSPTKSTHSNDLPHIPQPPLNLPNLIYISARPFCKSAMTFKSPFEKHFTKDKANRPFARIGEPHPPSPLKKTLPESWALGPNPKKPSRPPEVDLTRYILHTSQDDSSIDASLVAARDTDWTPVLDAPEIPDFETPEIETVESEALDLPALDLPDDTGPEPHPDGSIHSLDSEQKEVNLDNPTVAPRNPRGFQEPINPSEFPAPLEQWSQSEEATVDPSCCTEGPTDSHSMPEDTEQGEHANNFEFGIYQHGIEPAFCDNVYEDVENVSKYTWNPSHHRKWKGLKNPYADNSQVKEDSGINMWQRNSRLTGDSGYLSRSQINSKECPSPNTADFKEQKKREKQRLEREKKELKEREKRENEMKKKFKVTGNEEPLYHAKVTVANKVRKNDLPVKSGDTVSIIRTTNCPKGKWLARDANLKYGYISVMNIELNMKEMLELGKKAQAAGRGANLEADTVSIGSSSHPALTSSFTDDSEEWACEDEALSPSSEGLSFASQSTRLPETSGGHVGAQHTLSDASLEDLHTQTRHEALQKLAVFFQLNKEVNVNCSETTTRLEMPNLRDVEEPPLPEQEMDFTEMELLPPPPLYADVF